MVFVSLLLIFLHEKIGSEISEESKNAQMETRDSLLEILEQRVLDTTSYCRSKVLQTWNELCESRAIPVKFWNNVADLAVGRLLDKSVQVRKYAIQLVNCLMKFNPIGPVLSSSAFQKQLESFSEQEMEEENEQMIYLETGSQFCKLLEEAWYSLSIQLGNSTVPMVMEVIDLLKVGILLRANKFFQSFNQLFFVFYMTHMSARKQNGFSNFETLTVVSHFS